MIWKEYPFKFLNEENNTLTFRHENKKIFVKVFILEEDIIRVLFINDQLKLDRTWLVAPGMSDIPREGRDRLDITPFSLPTYSYEITDKMCIISTSKIKVVINLDGMKFSWYTKQSGKEILFARDRKTQAYNYHGAFGKGVYHYLERTIDEQYFGLGEKTGNVDRYGQRYRMLNLDAMGYDAEFTDPLYKHIPFYITRKEDTNTFFGIFYDNLSTSIFDMGLELDNYHGLYRYYYAEDGDLDYYVILGPEINNVTERFSWLTGKTALMPRWSIGYSGSTMSYTDAPNAQEKLQQFIEDCEQYDIPCDSFQLSSGYTSIGKRRYVFNWNYEKIPTPKEMVHNFHSKGLKLCANIKPAFLTDHPMYKKLKSKNMFILKKDEDTPEIVQFWDGLGSYLDFTNPVAYDWWKAKVKEALLDFGIDSTWNDNNEYEIWDNAARANGFGNEIRISLIRPLQSLLMMKASYEAQKEHRPNERPYLISRSGCPGMQRYVQTWSGDNRTSWKTLKYNIKMGIGLSLSGIYNFGHDVGGFAGSAPEPELFVRWIQNGIFHPRFTIHSWNDDGTVNEPWMYPEVTDYIRKLIKFRVEITPYIYNLLYRAYKYYEPLIRPTFYEFPNDNKTYEENDEFMLGPDMLVASVVKKSQFEREVYLPKNNLGWYDYNTGLWYKDGVKVKIPAPLDYTPLLVQAGSIIPINDANITFTKKDSDERGFRVFPQKGFGCSKYELYEDDGISNDYLKGIYTIVSIEMVTNYEEINIRIKKTVDKYELPYQNIRLYFPKGENRQLKVNGKIYALNNIGVCKVELI